ncbi:MAG: hypothetical protein QOE53_2425 [Pseudonocardiales bacterium]|nr:hypothetical protein [Pseudonocardiales bacterium]
MRCGTATEVSLPGKPEQSYLTSCQPLLLLPACVHS